MIESCEASLDRIGIDTLDSSLVHWPDPAISLRETLRAMAELREGGSSATSASRTSAPIS